MKAADRLHSILARLGEAVRAQNWFAVFLEFLIVAAGVLMGIQLSNWNDARREQAQVERLAGRLLNDFRRGEESGPLIENYYRSRVALGKKAEALWDVEGRDKDFVTAAYLTGSYAYVLDRNETSDSLAIGADTISAIDDDALRNSIAAVLALRADRTLNWSYIDSDFRRLVRRVYPSDTARKIYLACNSAAGRELSLDDYRDLPALSTSECDVDLPPVEVAKLAAQMRADPEALGLLREHINRLQGALIRISRFEPLHARAVERIEATH